MLCVSSSFFGGFCLEVMMDVRYLLLLELVVGFLIELIYVIGRKNVNFILFRIQCSATVYMKVIKCFISWGLRLLWSLSLCFQLKKKKLLILQMVFYHEFLEAGCVIVLVSSEVVRGCFFPVYVNPHSLAKKSYYESKEENRWMSKSPHGKEMRPLSVTAKNLGFILQICVHSFFIGETNIYGYKRHTPVNTSRKFREQ